LTRFRYVFVEQEAPGRLRHWFDLRQHPGIVDGVRDDTGPDAHGHVVDEYDAYAQHLLMYDEAAPGREIGTCRIIDGRRAPLRVGRQFGVEHGPDALEVSGFAVVADFRRTFATLGCYWLAYQWALQASYTEVHFEAELMFRDLLQAIGLPVVQLGPPRFVDDSVNVPLRVFVDETLASLRAADLRRGAGPAFAALFERPWNGIFDTADMFG
jgi:N-acyl-L-homoserine lactone synthetase